MATFETGYNGFIQSDSDQFDWRLAKFETATQNTGPAADHTTGTGEKNQLALNSEKKPKGKERGKTEL